MKKRIYGALVVVAIAVGAMIIVNLNKVSNKGDLALANVEALANAEDFVITCHQDCYHNPAVCWTTRFSNYNFDAYCVFTGHMSDKCYANKC